MKALKKITKEHIWLSCLAISPLVAFLAVYNPSFSLIAIVLLIIGLKGTLYHIY